MTIMGVKVWEVLDAARRGRALLAPEIAGYLVLAAAEQLSRTPMLLDENHCGLVVEGGHVVVVPSPPSNVLEAERSLRDLLRRLLEAANGRAPALSAVANAAPKGNVAVLIAELESALIPVNRSAAGRALSRLARDAVRARILGAASLPADQAKPIEAPPPDVAPDDTERIQVPGAAAEHVADAHFTFDDHELVVAEPPPPEPPRWGGRTTSTADVDELLAARLSSVPPPPVAMAAPPAVIADPVQAADGASEALPRPSYPSTSMRGVDELIQDFMATTSRKEERVARDLRKMTGVDAVASAASPTPDPSPITLGARPYESPFQNAAGTADFYTTTPPPRGMLAQSVAPPPDEDPLGRRSTRRKVYLMLALLSMLTLGTVTLLRLEPGFLSGRTADVVQSEKQAAAAAAASIALRAAAGSCRASLVVTDVPTGAEVLVRSGVAPIDVDRVPSRARLEFVALVDGYAPRRGVVPQGAEWDGTGRKPRFELPIQLEKSRAKAGVLDPWPLAEPGSVVGGQGTPGIVHVVTSPRGAEVWMVAGGAPEAKLESLPCGSGLELMIAGTAQGQPFRRRLRVDASRLTPEPSSNVVTARSSAK